MNAYQPGDIVKDRYRITNILGKGGVAITYQAINLETNSHVAIKVISLKQLDNWKQIELFQREAEVLAKLEHPAIPKYIDYFDIETETDKAFYIVQQQAPGKSLFELVESGWRTTEAEVKKIAQQILAILTYLHSLDPPVIHRDIKPNNLIRSDDGTIYLVDFGAVQNTYYNTLMQGSTVVGTYGYMAPEQFRGKAVPATDLYSLGATILYLLTHRSPAELPQDTLKLDFRSSVNISDSFADWLDKILEPDLDERFADAEVALAELLASKKVKQRKLITGVGIGVLCLSLIWGVSSYKWFFLSRLGFYPANLCSSEVAQNFFQQKGNINYLSNKNKLKLLVCIIRTKNTGNLKRMIANMTDISKIINNEKIRDKLQYARDGNMLLHDAVWNNNYEIVQLLINLGIDLDVKGRDGKTPLFSAIERNYVDMTELLITHGADTNLKNNYGDTPLFNAINRKNIEIVELLLIHGADVNAKDNNGQTPLLNITKTRNIKNRKEIVQLLLDRDANVNATTKHGETPLLNITKTRNIKNRKEIVQLLLDRDANVNAQDKYGNSPLLNAVYRKDKDVVEILVNRGADVNHKSKFNDTPLCLLYLKKPINKDIEKKLIDNGAECKK
ncbi:Ankyrin repeat protein,protein kinase family protein [Hyella patelloides LEGE 07179]|uniref:Ankyrin repeat protein,protein kinase family protein n=1 Tax=Hyella patelloides LEGE 07179 TaxID=945734 RepID=A0A563W138_9CYAN|nr:ankyrin repeat domain-containing protein [Hyella patelloides]VEP17398.1 Ankyrin repeat protein,protein kinase family protein [Hyella patelloides LEGE 07179]